MMSVRILVGCRLGAVNQHDFVTALAANESIDLFIVTDSKSYDPVQNLTQQRIYHYHPTWPVILSRVYPYDKKVFNEILSQVNPDVLLSLAISHLAFMGPTVNFTPTVFLPQGGKVNSSTRKRCRRRGFGPRWIMYRPLMWELLRHVSEVWAPEPNRDLLSDLGMNKWKLRDFDWGVVDTDYFIPKSDYIEYTQDDEKVVIGSFRRIRNPPLIPSYKAFFDTIAKVRSRGQENFHIVLGGYYQDSRGYEVEEAIDSKIKQHNLESFVTRIDMVSKEEMPLYYSGLDIYMNFSPTGTTAAIGTASKEAMSCACPFVSFDDPPVDYIIEDGINGFQVSHSNTERLMNILLRLMKNEDMRKKIGRNARETVVQNFSEKVVSNKIVRFTNELLSDDQQY